MYNSKKGHDSFIWCEKKPFFFTKREMNAGLFLKGSGAGRKSTFLTEYGEVVQKQTAPVWGGGRWGDTQVSNFCSVYVCVRNISGGYKGTNGADKRRETFAVLTAVLLVGVVAAVVLAVTPPVVRNAVVILAAEFMRSAGLFIFFHQEQTSKQRDENGFKRAWILTGKLELSDFSARNQRFLGVSPSNSDSEFKTAPCTLEADAPSDETPNCAINLPEKTLSKSLVARLNFSVKKKRRSWEKFHTVMRTKVYQQFSTSDYF